MLSNIALARPAASITAKNADVLVHMNAHSYAQPNAAPARIDEKDAGRDSVAVRYYFPDSEGLYESRAGDKTLRYYNNWQYEKSLRISSISSVNETGRHPIRYFFSHWEDDCYLPLFPAELYPYGINPFINDRFAGNYDSYYCND